MAWKELKECILEEGITSHGATRRRTQGEENVVEIRSRKCRKKKKGMYKELLNAGT